METIESLIDFLGTGQVQSESLRNAQIEIGDEQLRVVVVKLLGWMKSQHRSGKSRPLRLKNEYTWCGNLRQLMRDGDFLSSVFELQAGELTFASTVDEKEQLESCALVDQEYKPPLMT